MLSDNIICSICLEPINIIRPKDYYHSIQYISPVIDESPLSNNSSPNISPPNLILSPSNTFDISSTESYESDSSSTNIISPSIQHKYIETPELQRIIELQKDYINPCSCKNPIHIKCFLTWLSYKNTTHCEICNTQYNLDTNIYESYLENV